MGFPGVAGWDWGAAAGSLLGEFAPHHRPMPSAFVRHTGGSEPVTRTTYIDVGEHFSFPRPVQRAFADPDHTVIVIPDSFGLGDAGMANDLLRFNLTRGDYATDASHGGIISALLRANDVVRRGIDEGRITVVNLNLPSGGAAAVGPGLGRVLEAIPDDHRARVIASLSVAQFHETPGWANAQRELRDLALTAGNGRLAEPGAHTGAFHAFVATGNNGWTGAENLIARRNADLDNVHAITSGTGIVGYPGSPNALSPRSSVIGSPIEADPVPSRVWLASNGDINGDGRPDLDLPPPPVERSRQHGARPAAEFLGAPVGLAFATEEERAAVRAGEVPVRGKLYSYKDILLGRALPATDTSLPQRIETFTELYKLSVPIGGLGNPDMDRIFVDPVALAKYHETDSAVNAVVPFEADATERVQRYRGMDHDPYRDWVIEHPATSFAVPVAIGEFLAEEAQRR